MTISSLDPESSAPPPRIEHVVVLCLENRSFDHMLGFLDHPDPAFDGLRGKTITNPGWDGDPDVAATPTAKAVMPVDPDHSHDAAMEQLGCTGQRPGQWKPINNGFVRSLERKGRGLSQPQFTGLLAPILGRFAGKEPASISGRGNIAMLCHAPEKVPVLSRLALEFAVCTRWFSSVPGETWPNRNYLHAATSDGETNIQIRGYTDRTIFELLEDAGQGWHIYHDDTPQLWAFEKLWEDGRERNWYAHDRFAEHVAADALPAYSFMEPNHRPVVHTLDHAPIVGSPDVSTSQHPGNNLVKNDAYDGFDDDPRADTDFRRAEQLIAWVYETLRAHPAVFEKTLLVITYDENGGLFDHVPPPTGVPAPADPRGWGAKLMAKLYTHKSAAFDFTMLGARVPAVLISPYLKPATVDTTVRDHASVPSTLRALFAPQAEPLTRRDAWSPPFHDTLNRPTPRRGAELPDLSEDAAGHDAVLVKMQDPNGTPAATTPPENLPSYYEDFVKLTRDVSRDLSSHPTPAADVDPAAATQFDSKPIQAATAAVSNAFQDEARRGRHLAG